MLSTAAYMVDGVVTEEEKKQIENANSRLKAVLENHVRVAKRLGLADCSAIY